METEPCNIHLLGSTAQAPVYLRGQQTCRSSKVRVAVPLGNEARCLKKYQFMSGASAVGTHFYCCARTVAEHLQTLLRFYLRGAGGCVGSTGQSLPRVWGGAILAVLAKAGANAVHSQEMVALRAVCLKQSVNIILVDR